MDVAPCAGRMRLLWHARMLSKKPPSVGDLGDWLTDWLSCGGVTEVPQRLTFPRRDRLLIDRSGVRCGRQWSLLRASGRHVQRRGDVVRLRVRVCVQRVGGWVGWSVEWCLFVLGCLLAHPSCLHSACPFCWTASAVVCSPIIRLRLRCAVDRLALRAVCLCVGVRQ